jgi:predicted amidohydrolase YtcJ
VLDQNIFDIAPENIWNVKVLRTIVNGKQVYARE